MEHPKKHREAFPSIGDRNPHEIIGVLKILRMAIQIEYREDAGLNTNFPLTYRQITAHDRERLAEVCQSDVLGLGAVRGVAVREREMRPAWVGEQWAKELVLWQENVARPFGLRLNGSARRGLDSRRRSGLDLRLTQVNPNDASDRRDLAHDLVTRLRATQLSLDQSDDAVLHPDGHRPHLELAFQNRRGVSRDVEVFGGRGRGGPWQNENQRGESENRAHARAVAAVDPLRTGARSVCQF
jgi:hypothetical protein